MRRRQTGGAFSKLLLGAVILFMVVSYLPRCTQQVARLPGAVGSAVGQGASGALSRLWDSAVSQLTGMTPAEKLKLACEHLPLPEGTDAPCQILQAAAAAADKSDVRAMSCLVNAVGSAGPTAAQVLPNCEQRMKTQLAQAQREQLLTGVPAPSASSLLESCLMSDGATAGADVSRCQASGSSFFSTVHDMVEPIACGSLPKWFCTTSSPNSTAAAPQTPNYPQTQLDCVTRLRMAMPGGSTLCGGGATTNQNFSCMYPPVRAWMNTVPANVSQPICGVPP